MGGEKTSGSTEREGGFGSGGARSVPGTTGKTTHMWGKGHRPVKVDWESGVEFGRWGLSGRPVGAPTV